MIPKHVNFPVTLAPMVGLSHIGLRLLIKEYMPEGAQTFWPTEMLSSFRLPKEDLSELFETQKLSSEIDLVPQILGNEESFIQKSVYKLQDWGVMGIDINMGCPVKKALRHNYGVALMGDPAYAAEVVRMTTRHANVPVSVKLRAGKQNDPDFLIQFIKGLADAGASWITLHPRTSDQKRRGRADWEQIRLVKEKLPIPVIGNGDIQVVDDIFNMQEQTRCDMVMVGRALTVRPWLMWQYGQRLGLPNPIGKSGPAPSDPYEEGEELHRAMHRFIDIMQEHCDEKQGVRKAKFYINNAQPWLEFGHTLYTWTVKAVTYDDLRHSLERFFKTPQKVYAKTELRS